MSDASDKELLVGGTHVLLEGSKVSSSQGASIKMGRVHRNPTIRSAVHGHPCQRGLARRRRARK